VGRSGNKTLWRDVTERFPRRVLVELGSLTRALDVPGVGFDVIRDNGCHYLIDINVAPSLAIHKHTERPRDLSDAYLESWLLGGLHLSAGRIAREEQG
jgi:hypothetical protein